MAVISVADYKLLVTDYEAALTQVAGVSTNYYNAAYKVLLLNVFDPEINLLVPFHNAYLVADTSFAAQPQSVVDAVKALQNHILAEGADKDTGVKFTSINEYYADNPADFTSFFSTAFGALSQQAGFTIESTYIA
ncbi:MAG: hypothetical protein ACXAC5_00160 [Promethearchaeota archaeon]|jgi:hypothetical protein